MTPEQGQWYLAELNKLRDWRHNTVTPSLVGLEAHMQQLRKDIDLMMPRIEAMARADEIADAVTEHIKASRRGLLSTGEKIGGAAVGLAAIASVVAQFLHY